MQNETTKFRARHDDEAILAAANSLLSRLRDAKTLEAALVKQVQSARGESERLASLIIGLAGELSQNSASKIMEELHQLEPRRQKRGEESRGLADTVHEIVTAEPPKNWNYEEISQKLVNAGLKPDNKKLYNAIGYLHRKGDLIRVARGRYVSRKYGFGIITNDLDNE